MIELTDDGCTLHFANLLGIRDVIPISNGQFPFPIVGPPWLGTFDAIFQASCLADEPRSFVATPGLELHCR